MGSSFSKKLLEYDNINGCTRKIKPFYEYFDESFDRSFNESFDESFVLLTDKPIIKNYECPNIVIKDITKIGQDKLSNREYHNMTELVYIMKDGFKEFKKRTGRSMTFEEMRKTWG
jgi:hypothetical protein